MIDGNHKTPLPVDGLDSSVIDSSINMANNLSFLEFVF